MRMYRYTFSLLAYMAILTVCISCGSSLPAGSQPSKPLDHASTDSVKHNRAFQTGKYLQSIQNKEVFLRQFFAEMPKGGDLHNHLTGSVYAETYYDIACMDSLYVDTLSGKLYPKGIMPSTSDSVRLLPDYINSRHALKVKLLDKWSIRNFHSYTSNIPQDEHFFNAFGLFSAATGNMAVLINELKKRAVHENVQYLEIMGTSPNVSSKKMNTIFGENYYEKTNAILLDAIQSADTARTRSVIDSIVNIWEQNIAWKNEGIAYGKLIDSLDASSIADTNLVTRYLAYASRKSDPVTVLAQLHIGFAASNDAASKVVGVNIVSAENSEISMLHYMAHMLMFSALKGKYPNVKTSLHAGELTLGLVKPEDLGGHIAQAVYIAKADRIGHGVDIAFESSSASLLRYMRENFIPVEINLTSNEFILGVKDDEHPLPLYVKAGVPLVISTDDAGILRTNLAEQYVQIVRRYGLEYSQIKQLARNSISYSFLGGDEKRRLMEKLERKFEAFEENIANNY